MGNGQRTPHYRLAETPRGTGVAFFEIMRAVHEAGANTRMHEYARPQARKERLESPPSLPRRILQLRNPVSAFVLPCPADEPTRTARPCLLNFGQGRRSWYTEMGRAHSRIRAQ